MGLQLLVQLLRPAMAPSCERRHSRVLPDVPSMSEAGIKGYDATFWYGLLAPAGTPPAIVSKLNQHLRGALGDAETVKPVRAQGLNPTPTSPQEYSARIKSDYEKWKKVIGGA